MALRPCPARTGPGSIALALTVATATALAFGCAANAPLAPPRSAPSAPSRPPAITRQSIDHLHQSIQQGRYAASDSLATALRAAVDAGAAVDSLALADLLDLAAEAAWRAGDLHSTRAIDASSQALGVRERRLGPDHVDLAWSLIALGQALDACGQGASAESTLRRAVAVRERHLASEDTLVATAVCELGWAVYNRGNVTEARRLFERSLAAREQALGPEHPDVAASLTGIAIALNAQGDYAGARSAIERAIAITERRLPPDHPFLARRLNILSLIERCTGHFDEAIRDAQRAIDIRTRALGPDHLAVGQTLIGLGDSYTWAGRYREALPVYERGLAIMEKGLGPDSEDLAWPCSSLGDLYHVFGDEARGRELLERALELRLKHLPPLHPDVALSHDRLGEFYVETGECERALPLLERALAIRRQILPAGHVDIATSLDRLARCCTGLGDFPRARALYREAAPIFERTEGPISPAGWGYGIEGELAWCDGDFERSARLLQRALRLLEKNGPAQVAGIEHFLGLSYFAMNRLDAAGRYFASAAQHYTEAMGRDYYNASSPLLGLSRVQFRQGQVRDAFETARRVEEIERVEARRNIRMLPEHHGLRLAALRHDGLDVMLDIVSRGESGTDLDRLALDSVVRARAIVLDEVAARHHALVEGADTAAAAVASRYAVSSRRLASLEVRGPGGQAPEDYGRLLEDAEREREQAEQALAQRSAAFRAERAREEAGLDTVEAALGEGQALVSIVRFERDLFAPIAGLGPVSSPRAPKATPAYAAFVLRHGEPAPAVVALGDATRIDRLVAAWRRAARPGEARPEAEYRAVALQLEHAVWEPIARHLGGRSQVFVVPDGSLQFVNWGTMPVEQDRYLVERGPLISYLSAERDLIELAPAARGAGLLAIGAPDFDTDPAPALLASAAPSVAPAGGDRYRGPHSECAGFRTVRFDTLPGARLELGDVAAAWRARSSGGRGAGSSGPTIERSGRDATESAFVEQAPGRSVIHVATHAFFTGAGCAARPNERGIGAMVPMPMGAPAPLEENPLLLSGLVFAGANHRDRVTPGDDDGILTAEEIAALDLSGVEWAVLSGCETGVAEESPGEGVLGLRRAFQVAGVRTLIISLWPVEDRGTREWMRRLYQARLEQGMSTAASVREACLETLRERRARHVSTHPAIWGAFISIGDWR